MPFFDPDVGWQEAFSAAHAPLEMVTDVLFADPGNNDGPDWICLVRLTDGRFCLVQAGCDNTGWDCHQHGTADYCTDIRAALSDLFLPRDIRSRCAEEILRLREEHGVSG